MTQNSRESFLLVLLFLEKFRQNCRDDFLLDLMLEILAGDKIESVAFPDVLDTLLQRLCFPCWVGFIVPWIRRFLVGCKAYNCIERGKHVIPSYPVSLSSD